MASQELGSRPTCDSTPLIRRLISHKFQTLVIQKGRAESGCILFDAKEKRHKRRGWRIGTDLQQSPSTPAGMWSRRSRLQTWWRSPWTTVSRTFSCSLGWWGTAEWWWGGTEPTGSSADRSLAPRTHFYPVLGEKQKTNISVMKKCLHHYHHHHQHPLLSL